MSTKLIYLCHTNGQEYLGEVEKIPVGSDVQQFVSLNKARRISLVQIPMQSPQGGFVIGKQVELLPVALSDVARQDLDVDLNEVVVMGTPDKQMSDLYMKVVYKIEVPSPQASRIITG